MLPFENRHRPQFRCMLLLAQLLKHWSRATAIESVFRKQLAKKDVPYSRANLNPAFGGLTAQLRFPCSHVTTRTPIFWLRVGAVIFFGRKKTKRLPRWFNQTGHHSPLANRQPGGHFMSQPPHHAQLIRVDPCHPWFQNAIHQSSDELDVNPRSVVSLDANDKGNRAAASDLGIRETRQPPLGLTALILIMASRNGGGCPKFKRDARRLAGWSVWDRRG